MRHRRTNSTLSLLLMLGMSALVLLPWAARAGGPYIVGGFAGLDIQTDIDGYVGLEAKSGLARSVEIYFKRRY